MNTSNQRFAEITHQIDPIYQGRIISLQVEHVTLPSGERATREVVIHPGAVGILALDREGKLLVVEQYRKALQRSLVEIPAGKLEKDEDPLLAAQRELEEETGYRCGSIRLISSFYTSPGFANEIIHLYLAEDLSEGAANLDEDEFLVCEKLTLEQALQYIAVGRICDAKTMTAVYAWQIYTLTGHI